MNRPILFALGCACVALVASRGASAQSHAGGSQPLPTYSQAPVGLPYPPSGYNGMASATIDAHADRAAMERMRVQGYKRMQSDTRNIQELAAELSRQVSQITAAPAESEHVKSAALKNAARIDKLAQEVDRLMREH